MALKLLQATLASSTLINVPVEINLEPLIQCESGGQATIKVVDSNGYFSYGILQYQLSTFKKYGEKYGFFGELSNDEARQLIFRADLQRAIATKMLQEEGGWRHWKNCSIQNGYDKEAWLK